MHFLNEYVRREHGCSVDAEGPSGIECSSWCHFMVNLTTQSQFKTANVPDRWVAGALKSSHVSSYGMYT